MIVGDYCCEALSNVYLGYIFCCSCSEKSRNIPEKQNPTKSFTCTRTGLLSAQSRSCMCPLAFIYFCVFGCICTFLLAQRRLISRVGEKSAIIT